MAVEDTWRFIPIAGMFAVRAVVVAFVQGVGAGVDGGAVVPPCRHSPCLPALVSIRLPPALSACFLPRHAVVFGLTILVVALALPAVYLLRWPRTATLLVALLWLCIALLMLLGTGGRAGGFSGVAQSVRDHRQRCSRLLTATTVHPVPPPPRPTCTCAPLPLPRPAAGCVRGQ